ncbi:UPF0481 protein At3g47200-like [Macadamia integrifolia]|uniref:UPF0481 protein At3g47200-like n=1 Tax=Macadamia integrifolia TaxID=60698 RepID=UPI001C4E3DC1|nr:UPF0481 protein At3g47200-like [Macadamia integrifolia]
MPSPIETLEQQNEAGQSISHPIGDPKSKLVASTQKRLSIVHPLSSKSCIYRVPEKLCKLNEEAYTPHLVSIGPYHHGKENLSMMETHKQKYLHSFVDRRTDLSFSDIFVTMMLHDGCFILEFLLRNEPLEESDEDDPVSNNLWLSNAIKHDLILLENQLPFFVLEHLYKLNQGEEHSSFIESISFSFSCMLPKEKQFSRENFKCSKVKQMLGSVLDCCSPSSSCASLKENGETDSITTLEIPELLDFKTSQVKHLLDIIRDCYIPSSAKTCLGNGKELELPHNLDCVSPNLRYITYYATLLDGFIDSSENVALLCEHGIIKSLLGDHEQVSILFNNHVKEVIIDDDDFYFADLCEELNVYYRDCWHTLNADLRQNYFNTPWLAISVFAVFLVLLTFLQTLYTIKSAPGN